MGTTVVVKPSFHATQEAGIVQVPQQVHHLGDDEEVYSPNYALEHLDNELADVAMDDNIGDLEASGDGVPEGGDCPYDIEAGLEAEWEALQACAAHDRLRVLDEMAMDDGEPVIPPMAPPPPRRLRFQQSVPAVAAGGGHAFFFYVGGIVLKKNWW